MVQPTYVCDTCGVNYTIFAPEDSVDLPPYWFAVQIVIANHAGLIPARERDVFMHFCTQKCLESYSKSNELKQRKYLVDDEAEEDGDDSVGTGESNE